MSTNEKQDKKDFTTIHGMSSISNAVREAVDPASYDEYRRLWEKASSLEEIPNFPLQLDFELNYSCNFTCPMCTWNIESTKDKGKNTWFDFEVYKEVINRGIKNGLKAVRLNYINEPLIRLDISKFISYAKDAGILDIYFSTNGSLLDETMSKTLIQAGLLRLQVSLDAATKETYDKIRTGGDFDKIIKNIDSFLRIRDELKSKLPTLRVNFVKTKENNHELSMFMEYWKDKADAIGVQDLINVMTPRNDDEINEAPPEFRCNQPFNHLTIRYNGHILPCCSFFGAQIPLAKLKTSASAKFSSVENVGHKDSKEAANLMLASIEQAWNSQRINFLRTIHKNGEYWKDPVCKECVLSISHHDE